MKTLIKLFMAMQVGIYRLSAGRLGGRMGGLKLLLLTTTGRKSGIPFTTPLGCFDHAEGYVVVASNAGQPTNPAWYYNLRSNPQVKVQLFDKVFPATAEVLSGEARAAAWQKVIATAPMYAGYEHKTSRQIPLVLLRPEH